MSDSQQLFKSVLISNKKRLGLKYKNKIASSSNILKKPAVKSENLPKSLSDSNISLPSTSNLHLQEKQNLSNFENNLLDLNISNLNLQETQNLSNFENKLLDFTNSDLSVQEEETQIFSNFENNLPSFNSSNISDNLNRMEILKSFASILPTFSGNSEHLETFILAIDEFHDLYYTGDDVQKKYVLGVIRSKLIDNSRDFLMSRPDLKTWAAIKTTLREKYGDPINYQVLMQQLNYIYKNKNESLLEFVQRLKSFIQRIVSKIQSQNIDNNSKLILTAQAEKTAVIVLMSNVPEALKTILLVHNPETLDAALVQVTNFNLIESQINLKNQVTQRPSSSQSNHNTNNRNSQHQQTPFNYYNYHTINPQQNTFRQPFPRQPVNVQPRPVKHYYPTNAQVFGKPKNVFAPQKNQNYNNNNQGFNQNRPTPMSISTAGPSRINQNVFRPSGPRNFLSQELTNLETEEIKEEESYQDCSESYEVYPEFQDEFQNLAIGNEHENENQNFQDPASSIDPLT